MPGGWAGGGRDLPPDWKERKRARHELDNWTCVDCGWHDPSGSTLECDHTGDRDDHRIEMLRTRCGPKARNCHGRKTSREANARRPSRRRPTEVHPALRPPTTQSEGGGVPPAGGQPDDREA